MYCDPMSDHVIKYYHNLRVVLYCKVNVIIFIRT